MNSIRTQLVLSHILPILIIVPLLGLLWVYVVESQILLAGVATDLAYQAKLAAESASAQPQVLRDSALAEAFVINSSDSAQREIILLQPDGSTLAAVPIQTTQQLQALSSGELAGLAAGNPQVKTQYDFAGGSTHAEAFAPVLNAQQNLVGIVRVTDRLGNVYDNFDKIRRLAVAAVAAGLLGGVAIGWMLALRTERRLREITTAIGQVAEGAVPAPVPTNAPREYRDALGAVNALALRLHESEETRRHLLANLVHELGRPLGALQAAVHALQRGATQEPALRDSLLQGMDAQIERLKPLLDNLASLYTQSAGAHELNRQPIALGDWLPRVLTTWEAAATGKGLEWDTQIPNALPVVNIDADKMAQVVGNLAANAIKYTPKGGHVTVSAGEKAGGAWIAVADTGRGIAPGDLPHIFEPFYRGTAAASAAGNGDVAVDMTDTATVTNRFPQGMGLGLAIAHDIVTAHGGEMDVKSEPGRGSSFTIFLPGA